VRIEPLTEQHALQIAEWRYEFPYEWYDTASDPRRIELFANPARRDGLRAVVADDGELIGFFNFVREGDEVRVGLGIRPDLTGQGLGAQFIEAGLRYAVAEWTPKRFRLWVAWWNERALRAYRRAGFRAVAEHEGERRFIEMERNAESAPTPRCSGRLWNGGHLPRVLLRLTRRALVRLVRGVLVRDERAARCAARATTRVGRRRRPARGGIACGGAEHGAAERSADYRSGGDDGE
jgi:[ribosomal protein S18]-alanine N-acetyltransferase